MLLYQILVSMKDGKYKNVIQNNKFKISDPTWYVKFELPDGSYSVSDMQGYFEYIIKNIIC